MNTEIYSNNVLSEYMQKANEMDVSGIYYLVNIILFGSVIIFMVIFVYNFIKAYRGQDVISFKNKRKKQYQSINSMKSQVKTNICDNCGEENDLNSKFCKNCGNRLQ